MHYSPASRRGSIDNLSLGTHRPSNCVLSLYRAMFSSVRTAAATTIVTLMVVIVVAVEAVTRHPLVVILSFDGFHPDYIQANLTPHLCQFRDASAAPAYMRPAFPTKTFVNHFTMATGFHPETHGVLDNYMFDRNNNETMHYTYELFHYDESIVPIWVRFSLPRNSVSLTPIFVILNR